MRRAQRGSALITALMVMLVLVGLIAALAPGVRMDVRAAGADGEALQALYAARAGVSMALAVLNRDGIGTDGAQDEWATLGTGGAEEFTVGTERFRVEVIDASSRIDLNRADRTTLLRLPGIDDTTVDAILAWRGPAGAAGTTTDAGSDYETLPTPYRLKAAPFDSVEELLLVEGVTPSLLYGPQDGSMSLEQAPWADLLFVDTASPNVDADGNVRTDLNNVALGDLLALTGNTLPRDQAQAIIQYRQRTPFTSLADLLSVPRVTPNAVRSLMDQLTLQPGPQLTGRLNVNTATLEALETLPGVDADMAQQIVDQRQTAGDIQNIGDLLDLGQPLFRSLVDRVTTKSSVFLVRARGELDNGTYRAVEAWVHRDNGRSRVIRWREMPRWPGWDGWGWSARGVLAGTAARTAPG
jgi:DNA uptake protein ComE-like DNA-binding protein